ncbi:solute carrier organic anion transporter family member 4C1-like [Gigantopelta aegis]|uniref:solute carrier organic anion transporter family member 4C1-like n=1 Tax=Gigantopelta aegis TaxID=1735272 RepID=UPI001B88B8C1|nr:solute carrier organic anion transporter family member 4C1-like [Gigantopelta aegis]
MYINLFEPVCGADDLTYFSPCRAGCLRTLGSDGVSCYDKIKSLKVMVVSDEQRHLALGVQAFIYRTFGSIPGRVLFGVMFDVSCITFNYECGIRGNCWIYDNNKLGLYIFSLAFPCVTMAAEEERVNSITETTKEDLDNIPEVPA